jgi:hypothetical protein
MKLSIHSNAKGNNNEYIRIIYKLTLSLGVSLTLQSLIIPSLSVTVKWVELGTISWNWVSVYKDAGFYFHKTWFNNEGIWPSVKVQVMQIQN